MGCTGKGRDSTNHAHLPYIAEWDALLKAEISPDRFIMETVAVSTAQEAVVSVAASHIAIIDMTTGKRTQMSPELLQAVQSLQ
jgi:hypothetical protein